MTDKPRQEQSNEKNKGGRPPVVLSDEQLTQVEKLSGILTTEQLADYFGISRKTFYAIMERQEEVSTRYKKGRAKAIGKVSQGLLQKAISGDNTAMIFYLKTQAGWKETTVIETSQDVTPWSSISENEDEIDG